MSPAMATNFNETPTIDALCRQGMKFTDFYAATPVCSSTRCTIQSGQHAARIGITDFIPGHYRPFEKLIVPPIENELPQGIRTPGDLLQGRGLRDRVFRQVAPRSRTTDAAPKRAAMT